MIKLKNSQLYILTEFKNLKWLKRCKSSQKEAKLCEKMQKWSKRSKCDKRREI